jgi:acetyltransferase
MPLVAETVDPETGEREIVGVGRLSKAHGRNEAEFAILVADRWQRHGLGTELLKRLVAVGRDEGLDRIYAEMLAGNPGMRHASLAAGFRLVPVPDDTTIVRAELDLPQAGS